MGAAQLMVEVLLLAHAVCWWSGTFCFGQSLTEEVQCSWSVVVDELGGNDCRASTSDTVQQNYNCSSLKDTLNLVSSFPAGSCVEITINQGRHTVEGTVIIDRDLLLHGRAGHAITVELLIQPSDKFQYSFSFRNTDRVHIWNLDFVGSNGIVGFDNVSTVEVSNSSFR